MRTDAPQPRPRPRDWAELIRLSHTVFALPFALMAAFLAADGWFGWGRLGLILWCMVTARSAAMTFNRIVDVRIDARNRRTADRPIQGGRITLRQAWAFYLLCAGAFLVGCIGFYLLWGNPWPALAAGPVLAWLSGYSYAKRFTSLAHLWLGSALAISPAGAWVAVSPGTLGWPAILLSGGVLCWVAGFDIIYALQDVAFDRREGLFSIPARLGERSALWISRSLHAVAAGLWAVTWHICGLGALAWSALAVTAGMLLAQHILVRPGRTGKAGRVFFQANALVSLVLAAAVIAETLLR